MSHFIDVMQIPIDNRTIHEIVIIIFFFWLTSKQFFYFTLKQCSSATAFPKQYYLAPRCQSRKEDRENGR